METPELKTEKPVGQLYIVMTQVNLVADIFTVLIQMV